MEKAAVVVEEAKSELLYLQGFTSLDAGQLLSLQTGGNENCSAHVIHVTCLMHIVFGVGNCGT